MGGYFKTEGNFTLLTVPKSGHFVPADNYYASKAYLDDYAQSRKLLCHQKDGDCHVTDKMCSAMNNCNGNGLCSDQGQCQCNF